MAIPIATTTITIKRPPEADNNRDPYDPPSGPLATVTTGVRAAFTTPAGSAALGGGEHGPTGSQEAVGWRLAADPCDLRHIDTVVDETTNQEYGVTWAKLRSDPDGDLDHVIADVVEVKGAST